MATRTQLFLPVIDVSQEDWEEKDDWEERLNEALASRGNFLVVLAPRGDGLNRLRQCLDCPQVDMPVRLSRWSVHALRDALPEDDYKWLLSVCEDHDVRMIEQLHLSVNQPPRTRPYLVYCELHGIMSDHDSLDEAELALTQYLMCCEHAQHFPLTGVYHWDKFEWKQRAGGR